MTGIRVEPPTNTTSSIFDLSIFASLIAFSTGILQRLIKSSHKSSNFARVIDVSICFGPVSFAVINGKLIVVSKTLDNSIFAFSEASVKRCKACVSLINQYLLFL